MDTSTVRRVAETTLHEHIPSKKASRKSSIIDLVNKVYKQLYNLGLHKSKKVSEIIKNFRALPRKYDGTQWSVSLAMVQLLPDFIRMNNAFTTQDKL